MPTELTIRHAHPAEAQTLSALAVRSKAHWGYDEQFMAKVRSDPDFHFSAEQIAGGPVYVLAAADGTIVGMYVLADEESGGELAHLWLDPPYIGSGHGRRLFEHAAVTARGLGWSVMTIEADPNAQGFYEAMGAVQVGTRRSSGSGRELPLMRLQLQLTDSC